MTDDEAMAAFDLLAREEGIMPALKRPRHCSHGEGGTLDEENKLLVVNLSGRGDKDVQQIANMRGITL